MIASCSQTGIHEVVWIDGEPYGDGGARRPLPYVTEPADVVHAVCCSPIMHPFLDNPRPADDVGLMRPIEIMLDSLQARDLALLRLQAAAAGDRSDFYVCAPLRRYGDPFDASNETLRQRLHVAGVEAWHCRAQLPREVGPLEMAEILGGCSFDG